VTFQRVNPTTGLSQQEMTVVELFKKAYENDTKKILVDYFKGDKRISGTTYSSYEDESVPEVVAETYVLPFGVKAIDLSDTVHHISSNTLIFVTNDNRIYTLKDQFYSARRPHPPKEADPNSSFME